MRALFCFYWFWFCIAWVLNKTYFNLLSILASRAKISALVNLFPISVAQILASIIHFPGAYIQERRLDGQTDRFTLIYRTLLPLRQLPCSSLNITNEPIKQDTGTSKPCAIFGLLLFGLLLSPKKAIQGSLGVQIAHYPSGVKHTYYKTLKEINFAQFLPILATDSFGL